MTQRWANGGNDFGLDGEHDAALLAGVVVAHYSERQSAHDGDALSTNVGRINRWEMMLDREIFGRLRT